MTVSVGFRRRVSPEAAVSALREFRVEPAGRLPPVVAHAAGRGRDPRRTGRSRGSTSSAARGMAVTVGRVRACPILDVRLVLLGHNTIRGAAGQAVQIAELLVAEGRVGPAGMIVAKFGGTSVADAAAIGRLIGIVASRMADRPVVVVSALAGVTDALLGLAPLVHAGNAAALDGAIAALAERHRATARELPGAALALPAIADDAADPRARAGPPRSAACSDRRSSTRSLDAASSGAAGSSPPHSRARASPPRGSTSGRSW